VALFGLGHAGAIAFAGASFQSVQRWLGWKAGARAVEILRAGAGVAVLGGGAYFVYAAL
jgi:cytochrome c-type biogenesis protein